MMQNLFFFLVATQENMKSTRMFTTKRKKKIRLFKEEEVDHLVQLQEVDQRSENNSKRASYTNWKGGRGNQKHSLRLAKGTRKVEFVNANQKSFKNIY